MARFYYILILVLMSGACSSNTPVRHMSAVSDTSFLFSGFFRRIDTDNMFAVKCDSSGHLNELYYSFMKNTGDSAVWEEGVIRFH